MAEKYSTKLRAEIIIGTIDDPWIVYGKQRVSNGGIIASSSDLFLKER